MQETSKCREFRKARGDFDKYLVGDGIDIGCGDDVLVVDKGTVRPWDKPDGDAQLLAGIPDHTYDFVYSSHCLEHMRDVRESLSNWIRILKPGGYLYFVVPDYILYEKMTWPSLFNHDHKNSFCSIVTRQSVVRPNHFHIGNDLFPLLKELGTTPVKVHREAHGFNFNAGIHDQTRVGALAQLCVIAINIENYSPSPETPR